MRVTGNYFSNAMVNQLNVLAARQYRLQNQVATGQRIHAPEDDPAAMQRTLGLRVQQSEVAQFAKNISLLQERAGAAFGALKALKKISDRAGELATLADDTRSPEELKTYGNEVTQLIQQAVQLMNGKQRDQFLFGGTKSDQPPFTVTTDANAVVTGVSYAGNANVADTEIETGATLAVDVPGANPTATGPRGLVTDSRTGADLFNHLISLQNNLLSGNCNGIASTDRAALAQDEENLIYHIGSNGVVQTRLDTAATLASSQVLSLKQMVSSETDADMAQTIVQLSQTQTAYQAALQSGAGILKLSLMDYLR
jgi:flagellar hook-associated protein 3 FlgL